MFQIPRTTCSTPMASTAPARPPLAYLGHPVNSLPPACRAPELPTPPSLTTTTCLRRPPLHPSFQFSRQILWAWAEECLRFRRRRLQQTIRIFILDTMGRLGLADPKPDGNPAPDSEMFNFLQFCALLRNNKDKFQH